MNLLLRVRRPRPKFHGMSPSADDSAANPDLNADLGIEYLFNVVMVGDSGVGKSCLLHSLVSGGDFVPGSQSTIGVDFVKLFAHIFDSIECLSGEINDLNTSLQSGVNNGRREERISVTHEIVNTGSHRHLSATFHAIN